jgi:hypothetical protein
MKLKLDADGHAVVQDGKPVYVHDDGKEVAFDAQTTIATITRLNSEAKGHREAKEAAEAKLKGFEGIDDPSAALKALTIVKNLDDKKLVDAGEVEKVKQEAIKAVRAEFEPILKERDTLKGELYSEKIGGSFARSKFIAGKIAIPSDLVQARFGNNFEVKDGKIVAKDHAGNAIYSRSKPGEIADFEEALEMLVDAYPQKDAILKGTGSSGSGARGSNGINGGPKTMPRSQFEALDPASRAAKMKEGFTLTEA